MENPKRTTVREIPERALEALTKPIERRRTPWTYKLSLVLASLFLVALPLVYVGIVASVGWGLYWYGREGGRICAGIDSSRGYVLTRFGPLVVGGVLFFFLLKPLVARPAKRRERHMLDPEQEPFLYELVDSLAERLGAPPPARIDVTLDVNASASFANGIRGVLDGVLVLTIGLPIVAGMQLRELVAVLSHELGHISQGVGMRFYLLGQIVNHWLARVVYQRDTWDARLEHWASIRYWPVFALLNIARAFVWLSRRILFLLLKVSSATFAHMSRQMELDADQNAVRIAGSEGFTRSMQILPQIVAAQEWAESVNNMAFREGRLADDLPFLVRKGLARLPGDLRKRVVEESMAAAVEMYSTHPPTGERVARAKALACVGTFQVEGPATVLFRDYAGLSRTLTSELYESVLGKDMDPKCVVPAAEIEARGRESSRAQERIEEYFLGAQPGPGELALESLELAPPAHPKRAVERLKNLRHELLSQAEARESVRNTLLEGALARATAAQELAARKLPILDPDYAVKSRPAARMALETAERELEAAEARTAERAVVLRNRIRVSLELLCVDELRERVPDADALRGRMRHAIETLAALRPSAHAVARLARQINVMIALLPQLSKTEGDSAVRLYERQAKRLLERLVELQRSLEGLPYPYEHSRPELQLWQYLCDASPTDGWDMDERMAVAHRIFEAWSQLLTRLLADVAEAGLAVEKALGLPPLKLPEPEPASLA